MIHNSIQDSVHNRHDDTTLHRYSFSHKNLKKNITFFKLIISNLIFSLINDHSSPFNLIIAFRNLIYLNKIVFFLNLFMKNCID
jgi:hypothetical protein